MQYTICAAGCRRRRRRSGRAPQRCVGAVREGNDAEMAVAEVYSRSKVEDSRQYRGCRLRRRTRKTEPLMGDPPPPNPENRAQGSPQGDPPPTLTPLKINDSFSKIITFAVWATPWPPKGEPGEPRAAPGCPGWVSGGSRASPGTSPGSPGTSF